MVLTTVNGVGAGDLQHAVRSEVARILRETGGDALAQHKLLIGRLRELDLISEGELDALSRLAELGDQAAGAKGGGATDAYFESRDILNGLLADDDPSPVALSLASSAVGGYTITKDGDGSGTVVVAKTAGKWEGRLAAAGAVIGARWGQDGAAVGAAIGGAVGAAVDECLD
jgi:hypothetical protein